MHPRSSRAGMHEQEGIFRHIITLQHTALVSLAACILTDLCLLWSIHTKEPHALACDLHSICGQFGVLN